MATGATLSRGDRFAGQLGVDSGRGQNRTPRGKAPVECAIDGPLANGAAPLRHYTLFDDDIGQIRPRGITGWLSRSSCAFRFTPWVGQYQAHRRILVAKASLAALAYDSAPYLSRPRKCKAKTNNGPVERVAMKNRRSALKTTCVD